MAMANGVRTATNVVTPPSPYGPSGHYAETQQAGAFGIFPRNLQALIDSTTYWPGVVPFNWQLKSVDPR